MCRNCRCLYVQVWNLWNKKIKENKDKKNEYDTNLLRVVFVFCKWRLNILVNSVFITSGYWEYFSDAEKKKRCCIYFMWELFIMLKCALWCHWLRSMINHNGIKIKHGEMNSNVMVCITKKKETKVYGAFAESTIDFHKCISAQPDWAFFNFWAVHWLDKSYEFQNITLYLQQKYIYFFFKKNPAGYTMGKTAWCAIPQWLCLLRAILMYPLSPKWTPQLQ